MLHCSSSSDAHWTCTRNSRGTSGFRFLITATLVIVCFCIIDKHFERPNNWFCKDLCSCSCLWKFKRLQNLAFFKKSSAPPYSFTVLIFSYFLKLCLYMTSISQSGELLWRLFSCLKASFYSFSLILLVWHENVALILWIWLCRIKTYVFEEGKGNPMLWRMHRVLAGTMLPLSRLLHYKHIEHPLRRLLFPFPLFLSIYFL